MDYEPVDTPVSPKQSRRRATTFGERAFRRIQRIVSVADFRDLDQYAEVREHNAGFNVVRRAYSGEISCLGKLGFVLNAIVN
ncbi:unnamed protein product [Clavelina lepadiformis]|uniref:Transposase n=1 Tax=Clavelina lepadiformis TaxID=159417 RepID=A0ABP0F4Q2_CLALP